MGKIAAAAKSRSAHVARVVPAILVKYCRRENLQEGVSPALNDAFPIQVVAPSGVACPSLRGGLFSTNYSPPLGCSTSNGWQQWGHACARVGAECVISGPPLREGGIACNRNCRFSD